MPVPLILLIAFTAFAVYVVAGYPLLLAVSFRHGAPPITKDLSHQPTVSVIVAVHNGEEFVSAKLQSIFELDYPRPLMQVIVVSDGSTDKTEAIVREWTDRGVILVAVPHAGKVAALNQAMTGATGEILFFTDVRQPLDPQALRHLVANFADPTVGAVSGELRLVCGETGIQADMELYWRYEVWARKRHSHIDSVYNTTGCIYAIRRELAEPMPIDTLGDDAIMPLRAFFRGYRVILDPAALAFDYPTTAGAEFRRRLRTLAGLCQACARVPALFTRANRMRFHFLSHKFARLVLPWAILGIVGSSVTLPASRLRTCLLIFAAAVALLALVDRLVPAGFPLKRVTSPARTFIVMNAAALASIVVFIVPAKRLWRSGPAPVRGRSAESNPK
jgi:cellulose synthase/poly-beta-1,6-N-acetylglucosamine synthase-like glycosyltransferase